MARDVITHAAAGSTDSGLVLHDGSRVVIRYTLSRPSITEEMARISRESARFGDLLLTSTLPGPASCATNILAAISQMVQLQPLAAFYAIADDDAWLHIDRLAADLRRWLGTQPLAYGLFNFVAGWSDAQDKTFGHYGFASFEREYPALVEMHAKRGGASGPFPVAMGAFAALSADLAHEIGRARATQSMISRLVAVARSQPPRLAERKRIRCQPFGDATLFQVVNRLGRSNLTIVNIFAPILKQSRLMFYPFSVMTDALENDLAVLHTSRVWEKHFRFASCRSTRATKVSSGTPATELAPTFRCRSQQRGPVPWLRGRCKAQSHCFRAFNGSYSGYVFCDMRMYGRRPRVIRAVLRNRTSFCSLPVETVLRQCGVGAPS